MFRWNSTDGLDSEADGNPGETLSPWNVIFCPHLPEVQAKPEGKFLSGTPRILDVVLHGAGVAATVRSVHRFFMLSTHLSFIVVNCQSCWRAHLLPSKIPYSLEPARGQDILYRSETKDCDVGVLPGFCRLIRSCACPLSLTPSLQEHRGTR